MTTTSAQQHRRTKLMIAMVWLEDSGLESDQDSFGNKSSFMGKPSHGSIGKQRSHGFLLIQEAS